MASPKVQTILGEIAASDIGTTLMHEHLVPPIQIPAPSSKPAFVLRFTIEDVVRELRHARDAYGLRTVVDCTPRMTFDGLEDLERISRESGVHVIFATGCLKEKYYHPGAGTMSNFWAYQMTIDEIADALVTNLTEGIAGSHYTPGIIKVGTTKEAITGPEDRVLRGAARAHLRTGAPITTHATLGTMGPEQAQIFLDEGVDMQRVVIGHSDLNGNPAYHEGIVRRGATVGFDTIGKERFSYTRAETAGYNRYEFEMEHYYIPDRNRLGSLLGLVQRGHGSQIIVSSDMASEVDANPETLAAWGYSYLLGKFLPLARESGLAEIDERRMLVDTPRRILAGEYSG